MGKVFGSLEGALSGKPRRAAVLAVAAGFGVAVWGPSDNEASAAPDAQTTGTAPDTARRAPVAPDLPGLPTTPGGTPSRIDLLPQIGPSRDWQLVSLVRPRSGFAGDAPSARSQGWQIVGPAGEDTATTDAREKNRGACGAGMIEVQGKMKQHFLLDDLQMQACDKWIDKKWPERCGAYDRDKWIKLSKDLPTTAMRFCIDRYEYPNKKGAWPIIMVSWFEARDACKDAGKRLCTEDEWTFACEGDEATPYPNGYVRDPDACVNDRPWKEFHGGELSPRTSDNAKKELDRLWQGLPSGSRPLCKSKFGVYDMTGNVDEWTRSSIPNERPSVLKGGYWGPVRTRCRPATKAHGEEHTFYQQGFRCCADPNGSSSASTTTAAK